MDKVFEDVLDGFIAVKTAYRDYGVIIENDELQTEETMKYREQLRATRSALPLYSE